MNTIWCDTGVTNSKQTNEPKTKKERKKFHWNKSKKHKKKNIKTGPIMMVKCVKTAWNGKWITECMNGVEDVSNGFIIQREKRSKLNRKSFENYSDEKQTPRNKCKSNRMNEKTKYITHTHNQRIAHELLWWCLYWQSYGLISVVT